MRIAMLAPPWIPVPAPAYGGVEEVVRLLCEGLVERGSDVTLFAAPGSHSAARVQALLESAHPDEIERARWEADHVARAFAAIDAAAAAGSPYDVVHDHCGYTAIAMADRIDTPLVHTLHGPFDEDAYAFYDEHGRKATLVAISAAQRAAAPPDLRDCAVIHNPLKASEWIAGQHQGDHVLWMGRMAPVKGPDRAIAVAREAGVPLVLAGPVQPGQEEYFAREVEPHVDGEWVRYVGELTGEEKQAAIGAARAMLMPIRWEEPFGMVMVESMACGTPVLAFREGSAPEVVDDGVTGFLVEDEHDMASAIGRLGEIDRGRCRRVAAERFDVSAAAAASERVYREAVDRGERERRASRRERFAREALTSRPPRSPHSGHAAT